MFSIDELQIPPPKSWTSFERLVHELFQAEWADPHAQINGRLGQQQHGVDVFGRKIAFAGWSGVQCKNKDQIVRATLTVDELREEVRKAKAFAPGLQEFIVATTAPRDARVQEAARKITDRHRKRGSFSVHVYAWDDVVHLMSKHDQVARRHYGDFWLPRVSPQEGTRGGPSIASAQTLVLPAPASRALGILATSPVAFDIGSYAKLFPDLAWKSLVPVLVAANAVSLDQSLVRVPEPTKTHFLPSAADRRPFIDAWIAVLEPLRDHVDLALFLGVQYVARGEPLKALDVILDLAPHVERGDWNDLYASVLAAFVDSPLMRTLSGDQRRRFYVGYAQCLARTNKPADSIPWSTKLLTASRKAADHQNVAQAYLQLGLAHAFAGQTERAATFYRRAAAYAKRHRNYYLVGHALHNLAMLTVDSDPKGSAKLVEQSIAAKKRANDVPGRVGALFARGSVAIAAGDFEAAFKWFEKSAVLAEKWQMFHTRALALCNMAHALADQDKPRAALRIYATAATLAQQEGYPDAAAFAAGGSAMANLALGRHEEAGSNFRRLHQIRVDMEDHVAAVVALHDVGCCLLFAKKPDEARQVLREAYDSAVQHSVTEWIYRCAKDIALTYADACEPDRAIPLLREAAAAEARLKRATVSARLWESVAALLEQQAHTDPGIEDALDRAITVLGDGANTVDERLRLLAGLYQHRWDAGKFAQAIDTLRTRASIAKNHRKVECESGTLDQMGVCLQHLGKFSEAIPLHRKALRRSRTLPGTSLTENCLSNLGEGLRKSGKAKEAVGAFKEAESLARHRGDEVGEISIANNRALVLEDLGQHGHAARVLRRCRDVAYRHQEWDLYVRALHGLANHEWWMAKVEDALRLYRDAFREAKRHVLSDQIVDIAINYANALQVSNKKRQALRVIQSVQGSVGIRPDAHEYYFYLGATAADANEGKVAEHALVESMQRAFPSKTRIGSADAASALADIYQKDSRYTEADAVLKQALKKELPADTRASLLIQRLGILLQAGKSRPANRLFTQIQELCDAEKLNEELVDAHMLVGDHEWDHGKSKEDATKAYIAALMPAGELGFEVMVRTGAHITQRLLMLQGKDHVQQVERILERTEAWLRRQVSSKDADSACRVLLWPLRISLRLVRDPNMEHTLSAPRMAKMLQEEIFESAN